MFEKKNKAENSKSEDMNANSETETIIEEILENSEECINPEVEVISEEDMHSAIKKEMAELIGANKKSQDENKKLQNELSTLMDRLGRTAAEYENFRKRSAKEKEGIYTDACEDVLKNILPVLDNLERAVTVDGTVEDLKKGVTMTTRIFKDALDKLGVTEVDCSGEFDPNLHNAVMHIEDAELPKNVIVDVYEKGYMKGDKVLRYSMVRVAN